MMDLSHTGAIVLAAGRGTRIGSHLPKVLYPIAGKPMISYILATLRELGVKDIYVVTGYRSEDVQASIGDGARFVYQTEQLGTGHAFYSALREIPVHIDTVLVVNGDDSAFYERKTLKKILESHKQTTAAISLLTAKVQKANALGRIIRNQENQIIAIREERDATAQEKKIKEVNIGCYVFDVDWSERVMPTINKSPSGEYYIGDTVMCAVAEGQTVNSETLENQNEWIGVNTREQLTIANDAMYRLLTMRNKPTVFIIDNDNTLLNTAELKKEINARLNKVNTLIPRGKKKIDTKQFWITYERLKKKDGWISYHDLATQTAELVGLPEITPAIKHMFYTLHFDEYVFPETKETLEYLRKRGKVILFGDGDLVYVPVKIKGMNIRDNIDDIFVFEKKHDYIGKVAKIFNEYKQIIIDDQITVLEEFKQTNDEAITVWISEGPYQKVRPHNPAFHPNYKVRNIGEVENIVREWS